MFRRRTTSVQAVTDPLSWPAPAEPPVYEGAVDIDGATAQIWERPEGRIALIHPGPHGHTWRGLQGHYPDVVSADAVVYFTGRIWVTEPELRLWQNDETPSHDEPLVTWEAAARLLGGPPPMFPQGLRSFDIIDRWRPGRSPLVALARDYDAAPILIAAATCETGTPAHAALTHFAAEALWDDMKSTEQDIAIFAEACEDINLPWGALPCAVPEPGDLNETTTRVGWLELIDRFDDAAAAAVRTMRAWTSGDLTLPFAAFTRVRPDTNQWSAEWTARLERAEWKAAHVLFDEFKPVRFLLDPATGAACAEDKHGVIHTLVPAAIPSTAALDSVILAGGHTNVWVRDTDGQLWLAPELAADGIAWGYSGGGPFTLAALLGRLLDDLASRAQIGGSPNPGLLAMCQHPWPEGTVITRAELEAARDGRFIPPAVESGDDA